MFEATNSPRKFGIWAKPFRSPSPLQTSSSPAEVRIGPPVEDEGMARCSFPVDGVGVDENGTLQMGDTNVEYVLRRKGELSLGELLEGMKKLGGIEITPAARDYLVGGLKHGWEIPELNHRPWENHLRLGR
eukprot:s137_g3.t1